MPAQPVVSDEFRQFRTHAVRGSIDISVLSPAPQSRSHNSDLVCFSYPRQCPFCGGCLTRGPLCATLAAVAAPKGPETEPPAQRCRASLCALLTRGPLLAPTSWQRARVRTLQRRRQKTITAAEAAAATRRVRHRSLPGWLRPGSDAAARPDRYCAIVFTLGAWLLSPRRIATGFFLLTRVDHAGPLRGQKFELALSAGEVLVLGSDKPRAGDDGLFLRVQEERVADRHCTLVRALTRTQPCARSTWHAPMRP